MKFYDSTYEEYIESIKKYNLHPELEPFMENLPKNINDIGNMIIYGPPGVGKYSQTLWLLQRYSGTHLKYDKKIQIQTDKQDYIYHISDIHYEIDMSLLGCNSKILWNDIFMQIVDIISVKPEKIGVIVCKNFHMIHSELLEIFYSYIQQYSKSHYVATNGRGSLFNYNIIIHFILITENLSFLPNNILNSCQVLPIRRPSKEQYKEMIEANFSKETLLLLQNTPTQQTHNRSSSVPLNIANREKHIKMTKEILDNIDCSGILNIKEIYSFGFIKDGYLPKDLFNVICDSIINEMITPKKISFTNFRDIIYDILIYNLEAVDCIWYILNYCIHTVRIDGSPLLSSQDITNILKKTYWFLKYYNNNYRPIYHLESILFYIINKIHGYELQAGIENTGNSSK